MSASIPVPPALEGHPGLWGKDMEPEQVRKAYDDMLKAGPRRRAAEQAQGGRRG
ncbi:hypothetical protein Ssi03_50990 [Sphaerisporangium siamense]|uniref:Uncharacterized protein n=1 Tax=Sphaerisporangium siamense TaxID=795645 RepID=A0A7W7D8H2_9ACTN|nr:hypothetical protein [Sphaerisporangium siamense]MBB4702197.1 hypothetical protein [Sphaerisporangium siamense]GII87109.1 hypothetical protein Ssi03_50990 [Sphaerisporangium siamense]